MEDEARIRIGSRTHYLKVVLDTVARGTYDLAPTDVRNVLLALSFFRFIRRR